MKWVMLIIGLILTVSLQIGLINGAVALAFVFVSYVYLGFETGSVVAMLTGLFLDGAGATTLGRMSLIFLIMLAVVEFVTSSGDNKEREMIVDGGIFLVLSVIEGLISGFSINRIMTGILSFIVIYYVYRFFLGSNRGITVRRRL